VHVWDDYLIISYYTDGCIIVDAARPDNLIEVGNFDTYIGASGGYNGAWGAYPFLPSGNILISDRQTGLYVLGPEYKRGCYFEGGVVNKVTMGPVGNAKVEILLDAGDDTEVLLPTSTDPAGTFKTGKAVPGTFVVRCTHPDYYPFEGEFEFENGELLDVLIELQPKEQFSVSGRVVESGTSEMVPFANVVVQDPFHLFQTQADANGQFMFPAVFEGSYKIYAGNWGQYGIIEADINGNFTDDVFVQDGYYDDFLYNYGWTVTGANEDAEWVRAQPVSELLFGQYQCNPAVDIEDDFGGHAYVTGNAGGNAANDGVINGTSILNTPLMDLTSYGKPILQYRPWICQRFTDELSYFILVSNGTDTVAIDTILSLGGIAGDWRTSDEFDLLNLITITDQMQVHFVAAEDTSVENVVKAGLDVFTVVDALASSVKSGPGAIGTLRMFPNPASDILRVDLSGMTETPDRLTLVDLFGRRVVEREVTSTVNTISLVSLVSGVYVVHASVNGQVVAVGKVVVQ
jgi:hypothetical protein